MTIELYFSNKIEKLTEELADNLASELFKRNDKFDPMLIIIPNQNMVKWLQLTLSRLQGVLLNARFDFLENGLWYLVSELDQRRTYCRLMDHNTRTLSLIDCLYNIDLKHPAVAPIAGYLLDADGRKRLDFAPRLWQLARRLSDLFQAYEYYRADMIDAWKNDAPADSAMARCQQYLYRRVYRPRFQDKAFEGAAFTSLSDYAKAVLESDIQPEMIARRSVHIFGMSQIPSVHLDLLNRLAAYHLIHVYTLNPSQEFWEDIRTPSEERWLQKRQPSSRTSWKPLSDMMTDGHPLLAAWGKLGRENIRQLCAITNYTFKDRFLPPAEPVTLLKRIQSHLLALDASSGTPTPQDRSLQIFASPSRFREVETVYNTICNNLSRDDTLKMTDVVILVPDMNLYKPIFDAVFSRTPERLTYNLVDSNAQAESLYGQAVGHLFQLAQGKFTRKAVFELLLNPCMMQRWNLDVNEIRDWVDWAEELNIFHGFSRNDSGLDAAPMPERFSWKQALQRLRLGRIMTNSHGIFAQSRDYCDVIPFANLASANQEILEKFCLVIETLHQQVMRIVQFQGTPRQWAQLFISVCETLFQLPESKRGEAAVQQVLFQGLQELSRTESAVGGLSHARWDAELFREYVFFILKGISGGRGDYLTGGVTLSGLHPMRPIPFKIMFILGLEEGQFPGREMLSTLDLRQKDPRKEDVSLPERNCYLFLEMLLSVREKLYLGYVARDLQKDRDIQPCSVINHLKHYIDSNLLPPGDRFQVVQIPLKGNDRRYLFPHHHSPWSDVVCNFSLADRISVLRANNHWADFLDQSSPQELAAIQPLTPVLNTSQELETGSDVRKQVVSHRRLSRFLVDPVRQGAQNHLGLYDPESSIEDLASAEDEPFFSIFPIDYTIKMDSLKLWLDRNFTPKQRSLPNSGELERLVARIYSDYEKQSASPQGVYADLDRTEIFTQVLETTEVLSEYLDAVHGAARRYRAVFCGVAEEDGSEFCQASPILRLAPLQMTSGCVGAHGGQQHMTAEIHSALDWLWRSDDGNWHTLVLTGAKTALPNSFKHILPSLIAFLVLKILSPEELALETAAIYFHLCYQSSSKSFKCHISIEQAEACLKNILEAFGNQRDLYWLPLEAVARSKISPLRLSGADATRADREAFAAEMQEDLYENETYLIRRLTAPMTYELFDIARKRLKWIPDFLKKV